MSGQGVKISVMPVGYVTIPRSEYEAVLRALRDAAASARAGGALYKRIGALAAQLSHARVEGALTLEEAERLAKHITRIDAKLREFDLEMTPVRPPSQSDMAAAFSSGDEFARKEKRPR